MRQDGQLGALPRAEVKLMGFVKLLLVLAEISLWPAVLVVLVGVGMFFGIWGYDRMACRIEARADRLVTKAERGPDNVVYLSERIDADHRSHRLRRLLERS